MQSVSPGDRFGYWTVIALGPPYLRPGRQSQGERRWFCRCTCGTERAVHERLLLMGKSTSCSCSRWANSIASIMGRLILTPAGCAVWPGHTVNGYGVTSFHGENCYVHRLLYEHFVGPIPEGLVLDHIVCDNPPCANFAHLRVCTDGENTLRSNNPIAANARKTHCNRGHPYSGDNLLLRANGDRKCRTCQVQRREAERARKEAAGTYVARGKWARQQAEQP